MVRWRAVSAAALIVLSLIVLYHRWGLPKHAAPSWLLVAWSGTDAPPPLPQLSLPKRRNDIDEAAVWVANASHCTAGPPSSFACSYGRWGLLTPGRPFAGGAAACGLLLGAGVRSILFVGDSYVRHAYEGLLTTLLSDFEWGAVDPAQRTEPHCSGEGQWEERTCFTRVQHEAKACDGALSMRYKEGGWARPADADRGFDAIVWGVGNWNYYYGKHVRRRVSQLPAGCRKARRIASISI